MAHCQILFLAGHSSPIELGLLQTFHEEDRDQSSHQHVLRAHFMTDEAESYINFFTLITDITELHSGGAST